MRKKVLLVDDVDLLLELEKTFFWRVEIELLIARDGREALEIIKLEKPDLVFLDLHMPVMNGAECCRLVKSDPGLRSIPVVMLPHEGREKDLRLCREAGCDTIVFKPINRHHFMKTARKFLHLQCRADPRVLARLKIACNAGDEEPLPGFTVNLSTGGTFMGTDSLHAIDTPMTAVIELPELRSGVSCRARVAWVNHPDRIIAPLLPPGMGLQFLDLSLEELEALFAFVKKEFLSPPPVP